MMPYERGGQQDGRREDRTSVAVQKIEQTLTALSEGLADYPAKALVDDAKALAGELKGDLKSAQIRRLYGAVKILEMEFQQAGGDFSQKDLDKIILLRPKLAYAANKKKEVRPLQQVLDACLRKIEKKEDFTRFVDFFEAILAYHR
jgi:CRISPR-associated protein Csm2